MRQWLILLCHSTPTAYFGKRGKLRGNAVRPLQLVQRLVDATVFQPEDHSIFYNISSIICCLFPFRPVILFGRLGGKVNCYIFDAVLGTEKQQN